MNKDRKFQRLEREKEKVLLFMMEKNEDAHIAKEVLFTGYKWLVEEEVQGFLASSHIQFAGKQMEALTETGEKGLRKAISMYPVKKPASFSAFARPYIKQSLNRFVAKHTDQIKDFT